jgi:hypothetical protein
MTTVNESSVTYNRDGVTVESLTAQGQNTGGSTATITRSAGTTVVLLSNNVTDFACNLPSNAEPGDVVEIFSNNGNAFAYMPSGESLIFNGDGGIGFTASAFFRKVSSTQWGHIAS